MEKYRASARFLVLLLTLLVCGCSPKLPEKYGTFYFKDGKWIELPANNVWTRLDDSSRILVHHRDLGFGLQPGQAVRLKPVIISRRTIEEICVNPQAEPIRYTLTENNLSLTVNEEREMVADFYPVAGKKEMIELRFNKGLAVGAYLLSTVSGNSQCIAGADYPEQLPADLFQDTWYRTLDGGRASALDDLFAASQRGLGAEQLYQGRRIVTKNFRPSGALASVQQSLAKQLEREIQTKTADFVTVFNRIEALRVLDPATAKRLQAVAATAFDEAVVTASKTGNPADVLRYENASYRAGVDSKGFQVIREARAKIDAAVAVARQRNETTKQNLEKTLATREDYGEARGELRMVTTPGQVRTVQLFDHGIRWTEKVFFGSGREKRWFGDIQRLTKIFRPGISIPWVVRLEMGDGGKTDFASSDHESRDRFFEQLESACEAWQRQQAETLNTAITVTDMYVGSVWLGVRRWRINTEGENKNFYARGDRDGEREEMVTPDTATISSSYENELSFRSANASPVQILVARLPFNPWDATREKRAMADQDDASATAEEAYRQGLSAKKRADWNKATAFMTDVLQRHPGSPIVCNELAWLRATCPEASCRNGQQAVDLALKACELGGWEDGAVIDTLAAAYAETGDFTKAVAFEQKAISQYQKTRRRQGSSTGTPDFDAALRLYQQGKPRRQKVD